MYMSWRVLYISSITYNKKCYNFKKSVFNELNTRPGYASFFLAFRLDNSLLFLFTHTYAIHIIQYTHMGIAAELLEIVAIAL